MLGSKRSFALVLTVSAPLVTGCGADQPKIESQRKSDAARAHVAQFESTDAQYGKRVSLNDEARPRVVPSLVCAREKTNLEFANAVTQNLFNRDVRNEELPSILGSAFDRAAFVDEALASDEADTGITRFIANLFVLANIKPKADLEDAALARDITLVSHLKQEPIQLVLRNKDKPWAYFFTTRDVFCTSLTAELYDFPLTATDGFVSCRLPEDRAGFLGLASVLRAVPSSFVAVNNNYKRVAFAVYLAQGFRLLSATNGPEGVGPGLSYPSCAPTTDMRRDEEGLAFGTALVPTEGNVCASCHSPYNGPMSVAFRRFDEFGERYTFEKIDRLSDDERQGFSAAYLKKILNESDSCWSADKVAPPRSFAGQPGLSRLIAESNSLGTALGSQIPQMLGNVEPDANMIASIEESFAEHGETLLAAMRGFFLSQSFQCAQKGD